MDIVKGYGAYEVFDAVIAASASSSDAIDIRNHINAFAVAMPDEWTAASLSFMGATAEDGTYRKIVGSTGAEVVVSVATNEMIVLDETILRPFRYIKVRSGTDTSPVAQDDERTLYLIVK
jgi:hypothetical protein